MIVHGVEIIDGGSLCSPLSPPDLGEDQPPPPPTPLF